MLNNFIYTQSANQAKNAKMSIKQISNLCLKKLELRRPPLKWNGLAQKRSPGLKTLSLKKIAKISPVKIVELKIAQ